MTPTQRTLKLLREDGWLAEVVERWVPGANIRKDLFGWVDIVALRDGETLAVQCTSYTNISARVKKIADSETVAQVRKSGWLIWVIGWRKVNNRWTQRTVDCS
jgi:hypothetical protein